MKKAWTILLWLMILVWGTTIACAEEGAAQNEASAFLFRNGITWDSTPEMVAEAENAEESVRCDYDEYDDWAIYRYQNVTVSDYKGSIAYCFMEDKLMFAFYYFFETSSFELSEDDFLYLNRALTSKYGEPIEPDMQRLDALLYAVDPGIYTVENLTNWQLDDGTYIAQFNLDGEDSIMYFNEARLLEVVGTYNTFGL